MDFFVYQCSSHRWIRYSIQAVIFGYLGILHICALFLAFHIRKVKVKGLNDAKYIAFTVCIVTIVVFGSLITTFALPAYITAYATIYSAGLLICATVLLGMSFIPKVQCMQPCSSSSGVCFNESEMCLALSSISYSHTRHRWCGCIGTQKVKLYSQLMKRPCR